MRSKMCYISTILEALPRNWNFHFGQDEKHKPLAIGWVEFSLMLWGWSCYLCRLPCRITIVHLAGIFWVRLVHPVGNTNIWSAYRMEQFNSKHTWLRVLLLFRPNIRMRKKCDLSDFCGMTAGFRILDGFRISSDLQWFHTPQYVEFTENPVSTSVVGKKLCWREGSQNGQNGYRWHKGSANSNDRAIKTAATKRASLGTHSISNSEVHGL